MYIADTLSRAPEVESVYKIEDIEKTIKEIEAVNPLEYVRVSDETVRMTQELTQQDEELQSLKAIVEAGWPANKKNIPPTIQKYWTYREDISLYDGMLLKGNRVIIPTKLRR